MKHQPAEVEENWSSTKAAKAAAAYFFAALLFPVILVWSDALAAETHQPWYAASCLLFALFGVPVLDFIFGVDNSSLDSHSSTKFRTYFSWSIYAFAAVELLSFGYCLARVSGDKSGIVPYGLQWFLFATALASITGGLGATWAHELIHRSDPRRDRNFGVVMLSLMHYGHFVIAHLEGHHKLVGLPEDRNTARTGESFWAYFVRATCGEYVDAWKYDWKSTKCKRIVAYHTLQAVVDYICFAVGGYPALAFMMVQSVVAHMIVQTANYVTHYGITRKNAKEPITAGIAWEARHRFSGWLLLRLARHADHHLNPTRTYDALRVNDKSPTLPVAYTLLSFVAMFPPLWFALMNRRVLELRAQRI